MAHQVFRISKPDEYKKAGPTDLIELMPARGRHPLCLPKMTCQMLVYAMASGESIHISGPTGAAKSALMEALSIVPENFLIICTDLGLAARPLRVFPVEMSLFEAPGECFQRRALENGSTYDEKSAIWKALEQAAALSGAHHCAIWLKEIGRVHSSSVQGGLLNLIVKGDITMPDGSVIDGARISWVADSNYQAEQDSTHTLVTFDDALRRRYPIQLTMNYLSSEQEVTVLAHLLAGKGISEEMIVCAVRLGTVIRRNRSQGNLRSLAPVTIENMMVYLNMCRALSHLSRQQVAEATLLGNAGVEDRKHVAAVMNEVFGLQAEDMEDPTLGGNLF